MALQTFFYELVARGPLLVIEDNIYYLNSVPSNSYLGFGSSNVKLGLVPGGSLEDAVRMYKEIRKDELYAIKKEFIQANVKIEQQFKTEEERAREIGDRKLFTFIIKELLPHLSGHKEDLADLLGEEVRKQVKKDVKIDETELLRTMELVKRDLRKEQEKQGKRYLGKDEAAYFLESINNNSILVFEDAIYKLEPSKKLLETGITLSLNGTSGNYTLTPFEEFGDIERENLEFLKWKARGDSIDEFSEYIREVQKTRLAAYANFDNIVKLNDFNDGDIGFLRREVKGENYVYVYQIIPPFAMLDPRPTLKGVCYEFPQCRIAMRISMDHDEINLDEPVLVEPIWHPFIQAMDKPFEHICGGQVLKKNKKEYNELEWVAKNLDDAKNLIMHGLSPSSIKHHNGNETYGGNYWGVSLDEKLASRKITLENAKRKGLFIANKWEWS